MSLALSSDQLNQISGKFLDSNGKTLAFAVKKGRINHSHSLFTVISTEDQALFVVRSWKYSTATQRKETLKEREKGDNHFYFASRQEMER
jgi:hypothetical protein